MLLVSVRPEEVWPNFSSSQGIRVNLVYIVSLDFTQILYKFWGVFLDLMDFWACFGGDILIVFIGSFFGEVL